MDQRNKKRADDFFTVSSTPSPKQVWEKNLVKLRKKARQKRFLDNRKVRLHPHLPSDYPIPSTPTSTPLSSFLFSFLTCTDPLSLSKAYEIMSYGLLTEDEEIVPELLTNEFIEKYVKDYVGRETEQVVSFLINFTSLLLFQENQRVIISSKLIDQVLANLWVRVENRQLMENEDIKILVNLWSDRLTRNALIELGIFPKLFEIITELARYEEDPLYSTYTHHLLSILQHLFPKSLSKENQDHLQLLLPFLYQSLIKSDLNSPTLLITLSCFRKLITNLETLCEYL